MKQQPSTPGSVLRMYLSIKAPKRFPHMKATTLHCDIADRIKG